MMKRFTLICLSLLPWLMPSVYAQVSGIVFKDLNANGSRDNTVSFTEPLIAGIFVKAFNSTGAEVGNTTTDAVGAYSFTGLALPLRIEFSGFQTGDYVSPMGSGNHSSIQFYTSATTTADFGINYPAEYVGTTNPKIVTPRFVNGDPSLGGTSSTRETFASYNYQDMPVNGDYPAGFATTTTLSQVGSVWGLAFHKEQKKLFSAAFLKRHTGWGPQGIGGIYVTDYSGATPTTTNFADLASLGISLLPFGVSTNLLTNSGRGLPANVDTPSTDPLAFANIGKAGMGDIDLSDDGKTLYVTNLNERVIHAINLADYLSSGAAITASHISTITPTLINCASVLPRPFGLKFYRGSLYLGVTCPASITTVADLNIYVQRYEVATNTWTTALAPFTMNYTKGSASLFAADPTICATWNGWTDFDVDFHVLGSYPTGLGFTTTMGCRPSPILSDIEFDDTGNMLLGIMDRSGHQWGFLNYNTTIGNLHPTVTSAHMDWRVGGDILKAKICTGNEWTMENNGGFCGVIGSASQRNGQGPGGGEFFFQEFGDTTGQIHQETSMGSVAVLPGSSQVVITAMDPYFTFSGGTLHLNNNDGTSVNRVQLYFDPYGPPLEGFGGKANGLGDIELLLQPAPIEIGNRVWLDTDPDGVQDAGEAGISGVQVELLKGTTVLATATTDTNGNYIFSNATGTDTASFKYGLTQLMPNMDYTVRFPTTTTVTGTTYNLTTANAGTNNLIDSDAAASGEIAVLATEIPINGANNHSFDVGYSTPPCSINTPTINVTCNDNGTSAISTDDTFTFTISATGTGVGASYKVDKITPAPTSTVFASVNYSAISAASSSFPISGGNLTLTLTDNSTSTCTLTPITVTAPATCSTPPVGQPDLELTKIADKATVVSGNTLTYTLTLRNIGTADATGVKVRDLLPAGLTFVSATPSQGSYTLVTGIWDVGTVAQGATLTLSITVTVN